MSRTGQAGTRRVVTYGYDAMSRLQSVAANWDNNPTTSVNVATNAQYNFQGAMTSLNILGQTETRQYNTLGQLTRIQGAGINIEYQFSATANDGKITGQKNWATGEEVTYQYDALERLISAATVSSAWGLSWSYDGFGNRLNQNVTKGTAPTMSTLVDANTNRLSGFGYSYDGNGNLLTMPQQSASMTYDGANRMVKFTNQNDMMFAHNASYQYAPDNKRVWRSKGCSYQSVVDGSTQVAPTLTFYSVFGQKLGDYCYPPGGGQVVEENVHFGGRIVAKGDAGGSLAALATDRLHSKGDGSTFFPYGETKSGTAITGDSFATYSRDWSGLDYADQRWYSPAVGRFTTSDPLGIGSFPMRPSNSNLYVYASNDPINKTDSSGLLEDECTWNGNTNTLTCAFLGAPFSYHGYIQMPEPLPQGQRDYESGGCYDNALGVPCYEADRIRRELRECDSLPSALTVSLSASAGALLANTSLSGTFVFNAISGQSTLFLQASVSAGVGMGISGGATVGVVSGLGGSNSGFAALGGGVQITTPGFLPTPVGMIGLTGGNQSSGDISSYFGGVTLGVRLDVDSWLQFFLNNVPEVRTTLESSGIAEVDLPRISPYLSPVGGAFSLLRSAHEHCNRLVAAYGGK